MTYRSSTPAVRVKLAANFPARVEADAGVTVTKANGIWTIGLDIGSLAENESPSADTTFFITWNSETETFEKVSLATIIALATA